MLMNIGWRLGAVAVGAISSNAVSNFIKRRVGLPEGSMAIGLDRVPDRSFRRRSMTRSSRSG
jgi:hypothetical protein